MVQPQAPERVLAAMGGLILVTGKRWATPVLLPRYCGSTGVLWKAGSAPVPNSVCSIGVKA